MPEAPLFEIEDLHVRVAAEAGAPEILRGVDLDGRRRRGPRPHGPERVGQVDAGQHAARQPRVRGHRAAASCFKGDDITDWPTDVRAKAGIFLAFQYPAGDRRRARCINFLRQALSARKGIDLSVLELRLAIMEWMERLDMDPSFADRYLNEGFSGGEKKRNEILQMAILEPELAILDETDSGLDIDALQGRRQGRAGGARRPARARRARSSRTTSACSTHLQPDVVHILIDGRIVESGGPELAERLETRGLRGFGVTVTPLDVAAITQGLPDPRAADRRQAASSTSTRRRRRRSRRPCSTR